LNISQRTYNANNVLLSVQTIGYNNDRLPISINLTEHSAGRTRTTQQTFTYNQFGQLTQSVSPLAQGSNHQRYRTTHTYDNQFGLPLTTTFMPNDQTTVTEQHVLSSDGRSIIRTYIYENNTRMSRTDFLHDTHGNVIEIREFPDSRGSAFISTQITYDRGTLPQSVRTINVRDADNNLVGGNGIIERRFTYDAMWRVLTETDPNGYIARWQYDAIGRVTRVTFPNGGFITYTYNDQQNTMTHRTILGAEYVHRFDGLGNLLTITAPGNIVILTNIYDNRMRLIETRNAQGIASSQRTTFEYDIFGRVTETRQLSPSGATLQRISTIYDDVNTVVGDALIITSIQGDSNTPGITTIVRYDRLGRRTHDSVAGGRVIDFTHDLSGRVIREQSLGIDNTFTHNVFGITSIRNIEGNTTRNVFDNMGRLIRSSDFMGNYTRFTYDALGRLIRQYVPFERIGNTVHYAQTRHFYDRNGNLIRAASLVNRPGQPQVWATTENTFRHNMLISSQTGGANGIRTDYTYDLAGNILTQRVGDAVTTFAYDNRGRLIRTTDALGQSETFTYDNNGRLLTRTDRNGTIFRKTYDHMGRLIREEVLQNNTIVDYRAYTFTATGSLRSSTNGTHTITNYHDSQGRIWRQRKNGIERMYFFNGTHNPVNSLTLVNNSLHINNTYTYDIAQRIHTVASGGELLVTYTYNANGNITMRFLSNGIRVEYTYNLAGLVTNLTYWQGSTILSSFSYYYYLDGNIRQIVENMDGEIRTITYTYDMARRLIREVELFGCPTASPTVTMVNSWTGLRDAINRTQTNTSHTIVISNSFDFSHATPLIIPANRDITLVGLATLTQRINNQRHFVVYGRLTLGPGITLCGDTNGTRISGGVLVRPGGTLTMTDGSAIENNKTLSGGAVFLEGDGTGESFRATFNMQGGTIRNNSTLYGNGGGVLLWGNSRMNMSGGMITDNEAPRYGGGVYVQTGHINPEAIANGAGFHMTGGSVTNNRAGRGGDNTAGNISGLTLPTAAFDIEGLSAGTVPHSEDLLVREYLFDNRGNRTMMRVVGAENYIVTYTYDLNNRLLSSTRAPASGSPGVSTYTHDRNGNQLTRTTGNQTETRTYNAFNQLISVTAPGMTATYTYRADGLRHSKTVNGTTITHVWYGPNIVLEYNSSGLVVNRFERSRNGRLIRSRHHGWYIHNIRGDVVQRVDESGNILHTYRYSAFGVERHPDSRNTNPFRFAGEYYDWERGEYYLRARSFNPRTGRFTQPDPFWNIHNMQNGRYAIMQSANLFVYCINNPVRFNDPSGQFIIGALIFIAGVAIASSNSSSVGGSSVAGSPVVTIEPDGGGTGGPISVTRDGNNVNIVANVRIWGTGADEFVHGSSTVTHRQAAIQGMRWLWSGDRGGLNVNVTVNEVTHGGLSIEIRDRVGLSHLAGGGSLWSIASPGEVVMYTRFCRIYGGARAGEPKNAADFRWVAAHEFGHAMGIEDGWGFGRAREGVPKHAHGNISSMMIGWMQPVTRLDVMLAVRAHYYNTWQVWYNNPLVNRQMLAR